MGTCVTTTLANQDLSIRLPGGPTLQPMVSATVPTNLQLVKNLLSQASSALAPLSPVFNLIDAVLAIKDFAEAVPKLIVDPSAVIEAVAKLVEKVAALASLIPQLSVPILVVDLIDTIILALQGISGELEAVAVQLGKIETARQIAQDENNPVLLEAASCADDLLEFVQTNISNSLGPLNSLFGVINLFLGLIGQEGIPSLDNLSDNPNDAIEELNTVVETLTHIRQAIPIP